ncbi:MerR family transcriptional regulator [Actinoallomurus sp. NBC_01490]|uniref:MerR family transcriptional regulator n=1 Tax=Actinoallomurus sp. NBC_01490 TaxID=2903557 RepID=UPI002E3708C8|nr:MerR family transcriptional regulator [Actinoallomurus sp. NBC_01490]
MGSLTIGAFARAARLSPKALRLYDELGLLRPARVDPASGYRFYEPAQLERARLVAWLRRLGMPLARIRVVCELEPADAAREVAAYWARVEADTAARRDLAAFLIDQLQGRGDEHMTLGIRYAVRSDTGRVRPSNEDAAYAGARLLAVADGFGGEGHGGEGRGAPASAAVIEALRPLDTDIPAGELLNALDQAVHEADAALRDIMRTDPSMEGVGSTLTALLWSGSRLGLVHIGDSRAYVLRDGELFQITHDHTHVQSLIDEGRLSPEEAASHPQRSLLLRALAGRGVAADLKLREARPGDRYLLCSDGLSTVVPLPAVQDALASAADPDEAVRRLVDLANDAGGPDNVTCVVADVTKGGVV